MNGMTIVVSNWGSSWSGMNWLDQDTGCTGNCDNGPTIKIGNIRVEKAGGPTPPPTPGTGQYSCNGDGGCSETKSGTFDTREKCLSSCTSAFSFGNACAGPHDDLCGPECTQSNCKWSWPSNDPQKWSSKDAKCRCQPSSPSNTPEFIQ